MHLRLQALQHPLGLQFKLRAPVIINGYTANGVGKRAWA